MATKYDPGSNYRNTSIVDNKYLDIYVSPIVGDINDYELQDIVVENKYSDLMFWGANLVPQVEEF